MKIDLLNNKVNQMHNAFSQMKYNNSYNHKGKIKNKINILDNNNNDSNKFSFDYQLKENYKNNYEIFNDSKYDKLLFKNKYNYNNPQRRINSYYDHTINNNSLINKYDSYFAPLVLPSKQKKKNISRNINHSFNHKYIIQNKNRNKNNNKKNSYNITHNHFSIGHNNNYPIKSNIYNFGSFDNYFIGHLNKEKVTKDDKNNDNNFMASISNENENENNLRPKRIFNSNYYQKKVDNLVDSENKIDEKKDIENISYYFNNAINDENTKYNSLKNDINNHNNDINNLIFDQKTNLAKQNNNIIMNKKEFDNNNSNEKTNKYSLLNKLYKLGEKNEYKDKIENDKRNQKENLNNKLVFSNISPQDNNSQIICKKFKDVLIDKKFENKNKQIINNKNEIKPENIRQINTDINYNNIMKIIKKKNKKISFNEKENIIIKYDEKDEITQICIYDTYGRVMKSVHKDINTYLNKLKRFKPKSILLNYDTIVSNKDNIQNQIKTKIGNENRKTNKKDNSFTSHNITFKKVKKSFSNCSMIIPYKIKYKIRDRYNSNDNKNIRKKEIQRKKHKKEICGKFKRNPQNFYTETLCDLVIKSLDIDKNEIEKNQLNYKIKEDNITKEKNIENSFEHKMNMEAYNNLKKYFEKNNFDD